MEEGKSFLKVRHGLGIKSFFFFLEVGVVIYQPRMRDPKVSRERKKHSSCGVIFFLEIENWL